MHNSHKGRKGFQRVISPRQEDEILECYLNTEETLNDISEQFGISVASILRIVKRRGLSGARCPETSKETRAEIIAYYLDGNNWLDTAYKFGVHEDTVINILKRAGIERRSWSKHERHEPRQFARDYGKFAVSN